MGEGFSVRVPAQAGTQIRGSNWVPAFAGTHKGLGSALLVLALSACATAGPDGSVAKIGGSQR